MKLCSVLVAEVSIFSVIKLCTLVNECIGLSKIVLHVLCLLMTRKLLLVLTHAKCVVMISFDLVYII